LNVSLIKCFKNKVLLKKEPFWIYVFHCDFRHCWVAKDDFCSETNEHRYNVSLVLQRRLTSAAGTGKLPRKDILPEIEDCVVNTCGGCPSAGNKPEIISVLNILTFTCFLTPCYLVWTFLRKICILCFSFNPYIYALLAYVCTCLYICRCYMEAKGDQMYWNDSTIFRAGKHAIPAFEG
jgi:hypothetical protein